MNRSGPDPEDDVHALPHASKVLLYVIGSLDALRDAGMVQNGPLSLTPGAVLHFKRLLESGFKPSRAEILSAIAEPRFRILPDGRDAIATLIENVQDAIKFAEERQRFGR